MDTREKKRIKMMREWFGEGHDAFSDEAIVEYVGGTFAGAKINLKLATDELSDNFSKAINLTALRMWVIIVAGTLLFWSSFGYSIYLNFAKQKEIDNLNTQMEWTVKQYNKLNHEKNDLEKQILNGTCLERIPKWEV